MTEPDQRMAALAEANRIRRSRARARQQMTLERSLEVVARPPDWAVRWSTGELVRAVPGVGSARARRILIGAGVPETATLGALTARQRDALSAALRARSPAREARQTAFA